MLSPLNGSKKCLMQLGALPVAMSLQPVFHGFRVDTTGGCNGAERATCCGGFFGNLYELWRQQGRSAHLVGMVQSCPVYRRCRCQTAGGS